MSDSYNFHGETQFIKEAKDNVSIVQNIYKDAPDIERKLDEMFEKINEEQSAEMNTLIDALFQKIDESRLKANQFSNEEIEEFKRAKYSNDTKLKLKWTYPLSGVIKELTGFSAEFEHELKRSKEIKPDWFLQTLRKFILAHELQQIGFNEIKTIEEKL